MSAFSSTKEIEFRVWERIRPFVEEISDGRLVLVSKGKHARRLQEELGDVLVNVRSRDGMKSIEIKGEEIDTGNVFLEVWSNRNLEDAVSHAERGSNPGWMFKTRADVLLFYFLDTDRLVIVNTFALLKWAFTQCRDNQPWNICRYDEKRQGKYFQRNDTWGMCVPIAHLEKILGPRSVKVTSARQLTMFDTWEAAE